MRTCEAPSKAWYRLLASSKSPWRTRTPRSLRERAFSGLRTLTPNWVAGSFSRSRSAMAWPSFPVAPVTMIINCFFLALLGADPGHFAEPVIGEVLGLPFFDRLQNEIGDEFGLVAIGVIGRRSPAGRTSHPVVAKVRRRDERIDFTDDYAVLFQLGASREAESKKRTLRRRVHAVLRNSHERRPRIDIHNASAALRSHHRNGSLHRDNRPQHVEMEDFVKEFGIDLLHGGRIAAPCIVYEAIDAAVMPVHSAYGFPHSIKLRHIYRDRQAAWKPSRQFLQRIATASEQGDLRASLGQSNSRRQSYPRRSTRDNEDTIVDLHRFILLRLDASRRRRNHCFTLEIAHVFEIGDQPRPGRAPCQPFLRDRA